MADRKFFQHDNHPTIVSFRIAAIASAFTAVVVFAWATRAHQKLGIYADTDGAPLCGMILATTSYSLLWSMVPLTARLLLHRSLHPGVYVAFDFIAFGAVFATTIVTMILLIPAAEGGYACRGGGYGVCRNNTLSNVEFFGYAIALLDSMLHFVLFVWACWACHRHRKQPRKIDI
ncbi:hypothetical protein BBP40_010153 [Aspergillus hancockii]|nr:hypothetical protein BBP40_010153 [Aspergillus hancockii]